MDNSLIQQCNQQLQTPAHASLQETYFKESLCESWKYIITLHARTNIFPAIALQDAGMQAS